MPRRSEFLCLLTLGVAFALSPALGTKSTGKKARCAEQIAQLRENIATATELARADLERGIDAVTVALEPAFERYSVYYHGLEPEVSLTQYREVAQLALRKRLLEFDPKAPDLREKLSGFIGSAMASLHARRFYSTTKARAVAWNL